MCLRSYEFVAIQEIFETLLKSKELSHSIYTHRDFKISQLDLTSNEVFTAQDINNLIPGEHSPDLSSLFLTA